jgi:hypothetical protein
MEIRIASNFHVFVPTEDRDRKVAFTEGTEMGPGDMPAGQSMSDWKEKGLAVAVEEVGVFDARTEG